MIVTLCSNECNMPYRAKTIFTNNLADSDRLILDNRLEIVFKYSDLDWRHKNISAAVICDLKNPSSTTQVLDRNIFSALSLKGIKFHMTPMLISNNLKISEVPSEYPVAPGQKDDYIFIFMSDSVYTKKQAIDLIKNDTFFFLYKLKTCADTLLKIVAADSRITQSF